MRLNACEPALVATAALVVVVGCGGAEEAVRVRWPVVADAAATLPVTTNLGYRVELTEARAAVEHVTFAIAGEAHTASLWRRAVDALLPAAHAHPGHFQGGDVTGELGGRHVLAWLPAGGPSLGEATLIVGAYQSANLTFVRAGIDDGLAADDPLVGHTALLRGRATRADRSVAFVAFLDAPADRELTGIPFVATVRADEPRRLGVQLGTADPLQADTLFDGIDFDALDSDGDGALVLDASSDIPAVVDATFVLRRTFQTHDHFSIAVLPAR